MGDLLGEDVALVQPNTLYRCHDFLLARKARLFTFLRERWTDMFQADFDVLLYDLTSTYFECDPPEAGKRKHGYSRDKRPDCVQVVIALVITPDGPHRVHVGDVVEESDGDLMGDGVSVAARGGGRRAGRPLPFRGRLATR